MRTSVTLRGQDWDVEYRDHGWEPDTNVHEIDWDFTEPDAPRELSDEEEDSVYQQLLQRGHDYFPDDVI